MNDAVLYEDELLQVRAVERFIIVVEQVSSIGPILEFFLVSASACCRLA